MQAASAASCSLDQCPVWAACSEVHEVFAVDAAPQPRSAQSPNCKDDALQRMVGLVDLRYDE